MSTASIDASGATTAAATPALSWSDRLLPALLLGSIAIGLTVGVVTPDIGTRLAHGVSIGVFALIYVVMLGIGTGGIVETLTHRGFLATAIGLNFVVNPLLAWALGSTFLRSAPDLRIGLILFLVTPCIGWYIVFTEMAGGDTVLGISLLGVNIVLQILLLPLYLIVFVGDSIDLPMSTIARSVVLYLVAPAVLAAFTRTHWSRRGVEPGVAADRLHASSVKATLLSIVIVSMFASQARTIVDEPEAFLRLLIPLTAFFAATFCIALTVGRRSGMPHRHVVLLVFTTTSRNSEASLAIAATAFASPLVGLAVVLGPVIELPLLVVMVRILDRLATRGP